MSIQQQLEQKLTERLKPIYLEVVNESQQHNVPQGSESHFKITVVAHAFNDQTPVAQHRLVYRLLAEELQAGIHALALHTYTAAAWSQLALKSAPQSPRCRGGKASENTANGNDADGF